MIPKIKLESLEISKMVCGTNQFIGISHVFGLHRIRDPGLIHRSPLSWIYYAKKFKKVERIAEIMIYLAQEHGVNACVSSPRERIYDAIQLTEKETGEKFHWICSPSKRGTVKGLEKDEIKQIEWCAEHGVTVCGPHRSFTDKQLNVEEGIIDGVEPLLERVRDLGMVPLLSTHSHEVPSIIEKQGYDVSLVIQPLNLKGYMSNTTPDQLIEDINNTNIQILGIKPMAAGRIRPRDGIPFALKNIKENDLLAVGFGDIDFAKEDAAIFEETLATMK